MIKIIKQEIEVEETLKKKIEFICEFANVKYKLELKKKNDAFYN